MGPGDSHTQRDDAGLEWLMQIAYLAGKSLDAEENVPPVLAAMAGLVPCEDLVLLQVRDDVMEMTGHWSRPGSTPGMGGSCAFKRQQQAFCERRVVKGKPAEALELPYLSGRDEVMALIVPLVMDYVCIGRLDFIRDWRAEPFSEWEQQCAQACGRLLALSLHNSAEYARVAWLADHDALTGIGNRRTFDMALNRELARAERYRRDVSLLLIDLDDFKEANTHLGLSGGDEILRRTAKVLAERARKGVDISCRIGGDEFAMILPEIGEGMANDLAQRLVKDVATATMSLWPMRFSYSISTYPSTSAELLRRAADVKLMAAKTRKGRIAVPVGSAVQ
ncbi:MAG: sensor domain-containing diguanylate cyclase [Gammaproteobacteria bacterium]|nr:sensor domain-containing diguanylate cyclase [Gammaproteobacteria bacterium]